MSHPDRPRSELLASLLESARKGLSKLDTRVSGLEIANSPVSRERSPEIHRSMRSEARACFVLSTGRTGTMTLTALMDSSPRVEAHHEPEPRLIAASWLAWRDRWADATFWQDAVAVARDPLVLGAHKRGKLYFESNNRMTLLAPVLAELYPQSRFLLVTRKPEAFVRSAMRRGYYQGHPWDHARLRPRPDDAGSEAWGDLPPEEQCVWLWHETNAYALDFLDSIDSDRGMVLHAEDLFAGDLGRLGSVMGFVGIDNPPSERRMKGVLQNRLNQQKGEHPHGREPSWDGARLNAALAPLSPMLERLGYED
ncbi:MAG: hypothetical protein VX498_00505 [Myxococcota bacterium]|nr:hypothetical protein [Myxococcota bacterium]